MPSSLWFFNIEQFELKVFGSFADIILSSAFLRLMGLCILLQNGVKIQDYWIINGKNYSKTLEAWLSKLDQNKDKVMKLLRQAYGDDADQQLFNWRLFFIFCSEVFGYSDGNEWIISQHLFKKQYLSSL